MPSPSSSLKWEGFIFFLPGVIHKSSPSWPLQRGAATITRGVSTAAFGPQSSLHRAVQPAIISRWEFQPLRGPLRLLLDCRIPLLNRTPDSASNTGNPNDAQSTEPIFASCYRLAVMVLFRQLYCSRQTLLLLPLAYWRQLHYCWCHYLRAPTTTKITSLPGLVGGVSVAREGGRL